MDERQTVDFSAAPIDHHVEVFERAGPPVGADDTGLGMLLADLGADVVRNPYIAVISDAEPSTIAASTTCPSPDSRASRTAETTPSAR